jgi:acetoin utilization protein AcuB
MLVQKIMSENLFTVHPETPVTDAQDLMRREKLHHLPVVNSGSRKLVGIVSEKDLLYASPSPASTLDVYEMTRLLAKLTVAKVMTKTVITVDPTELVEEAARKMVDNNIGCVPVVDGEGFPVGIVTETDMFRLFIDMFGTRERGLRATLRIPEERGEIAKLAGDIAGHDGNIISIGTLPGDKPTNAVCVLKVAGMNRDQFLSSVENHILEVIDLRET